MVRRIDGRDEARLSPGLVGLDRRLVQRAAKRRSTSSAVNRTTSGELSTLPVAEEVGDGLGAAGNRLRLDVVRVGVCCLQEVVDVGDAAHDLHGGRHRCYVRRRLGLGIDDYVKASL